LITGLRSDGCCPAYLLCMGGQISWLKRTCNRGRIPEGSSPGGTCRKMGNGSDQRLIGMTDLPAEGD
jgi:hypothetical protein